jgi:hypothetical protein
VSDVRQVRGGLTAGPSVRSASNPGKSNIPASRYRTARGKPKRKF